MAMETTATAQQSTDIFYNWKSRGGGWPSWRRRWAQAGVQWGLMTTRRNEAAAIGKTVTAGDTTTII